jgi:hypothetical protein
MKIRNSLVSNSSSQSFCIVKNRLTPEQVEIVRKILDSSKKEMGYHALQYEEAEVFLGESDFSFTLRSRLQEAGIPMNALEQ